MAIRSKPVLIFSAFIVALLHILWEHFNGGVLTHHLLADANNPGFSNWWGLLSLPALTWAALTAIEKRNPKESGDFKAAGISALQKKYFFAGLIFSLLASLLWEFDQEGVLQYFILLPWALSFFLRIYLPETTLGFVLGMTYTFGGVLPILFSVVIQGVGFLIYSIVYRGGKRLLEKLLK